MEITTEQVAEIESKISAVKETVAKVEELLADMKVCTGNSTKTLIFSAAKKQLQAAGIIA